MKKTGAQIIWECAAAAGHQHGLRLSGRRDSPRLRCHDPIPDPAHPRPPRAGRDAHGRRVRARDRAGGRRHCHVRPRRDQHGHRHRDGHARLLSDRVHHRTGRQQVDRQRRLPGNRHHRRHAPDHQAQLPGDARRRCGADDSRGLPRRRLRTSGTGADRHHEGRAAVLVRVRLGRRRAKAGRLSARPSARAGRLQACNRADPRGEAAADSRGPRHHPVAAPPSRSWRSPSRPKRRSR